MHQWQNADRNLFQIVNNFLNLKWFSCAYVACHDTWFLSDVMLHKVGARLFTLYRLYNIDGELKSVARVLVYVRVYACEMIEAEENNNEKPVQNNAE